MEDCPIGGATTTELLFWERKGLVERIMQETSDRDCCLVTGPEHLPEPDSSAPISTQLVLVKSSASGP